MKHYSKYEAVFKNYIADLKTREVNLYEGLELDDFVIVGSLMEDIANEIKLTNNRNVILSSILDERYNFKVTEKVNVLSVISVALCLAAFLDEKLTKEDKIEIMEQYKEQIGSLDYKRFEFVMENDRKGIDFNFFQSSQR